MSARAVNQQRRAGPLSPPPSPFSLLDVFALTLSSLSLKTPTILSNSCWLGRTSSPRCASSAAALRVCAANQPAQRSTTPTANILSAATPARLPTSIIALTNSTSSCQRTLGRGRKASGVSESVAGDGVEGVASLPALRLSAVSHDDPVRERGGRASRVCTGRGGPGPGGEEQTTLRVAQYDAGDLAHDVGQRVGAPPSGRRRRYITAGETREPPHQPPTVHGFANRAHYAVSFSFLSFNTYFFVVVVRT